MSEYTFEEIRRLFMVVSLYPGVVWKKKTEYYNFSAVVCGEKQWIASILKSYWALHNRQWCAARILNDSFCVYKSWFWRAKARWLLIRDCPRVQINKINRKAWRPKASRGKSLFQRRVRCTYVESLSEPRDEGNQHSSPISGYLMRYIIIQYRDSFFYWQRKATSVRNRSGAKATNIKSTL